MVPNLKYYFSFNRIRIRASVSWLEKNAIIYFGGSTTSFTFPLFDTVQNKRRVDVFLTHSLPLSYFFLQFSCAPLCPFGAKHINSMSPSPNPLAPWAKDSSKAGNMLFYLYGLWVQMESSLGVTLGQLVGDTAHATDQ